MNDNPDPAQVLIGNTLAAVTIIMDHMDRGFTRMLEANGLTPEFIGAVKEFLDPAMKILDRLEHEVIDYAQAQTRFQLLAPDATAPWTARLEAFAEEFDRQAKSPMQKFLAADFKVFVTELTGVREMESQDARKEMELEM